MNVANRYSRQRKGLRGSIVLTAVLYIDRQVLSDDEATTISLVFYCSRRRKVYDSCLIKLLLESTRAYGDFLRGPSSLPTLENHLIRRNCEFDCSPTTNEAHMTKHKEWSQGVALRFSRETFHALPLMPL